MKNFNSPFYFLYSRLNRKFPDRTQDFYSHQRAENEGDILYVREFESEGVGKKMWIDEKIFYLIDYGRLNLNDYM